MTKTLTITLVCVLLAGRAEAQAGWSETFSSERLATVDAPLDTVMVIPAGADPARGSAADALLAALRRSGIVSLVMDSSALGDVSALADPAIVARAQGEPVATLAIVRVYPNADRPSVVVSFYDKAGRSLGALTGDASAPMPADAQPAPTPPPPPDPPAIEAPRGTVPVTFDSASAQVPLNLSAYEGSYTSIESTRHHGDYLAIHSINRPLCTTPCTLELPPGKFLVGVDGIGTTSYYTTVKVPPTGADVKLRVTSPVGLYVARLLTWPGLVSAVGGAVLLGVSRRTEHVTTVSGDVISTRGYSRSPLIAGGTFLAVGAAMLGAGIPLYLINAGAGAASVHPHAATQPSAQVTVGPTSLGLRGAF